jgi:hypothetical protein
MKAAMRSRDSHARNDEFKPDSRGRGPGMTKAVRMMCHPFRRLV